MYARLVARTAIVLLFVAAALTPFCIARAQTSDQILWEMAAPAAVAQGYTYDLEVDGARWPASLGGVACRAHNAQAPSTSRCTGSLPAIPGLHTGRIRAVDLPFTGASATGYYSAPFIIGQVAGGIVVALKPVPPTPASVRVGER